MFKQIFVEKEVATLEQTQKILAGLKRDDFELIDAMEDYWGVTKKPYLQKRTGLNLFIARKKGQLIKATPAAYGLDNGEHYYYVHAFNCIYECQYCYLQGYFNTPDLVLFVNHQEIIEEMQKLVDQSPDKTLWFHSGEYSDSLALSHITQELDLYWDFFSRNPNAKLEVRTKSVNIRSVLQLPALPNAIISFSLSAHKTAKDIDLKCPSVKARIKAMAQVAQAGHPVGIHLDPIVYEDDFAKHYQELVQDIFEQISASSVEYVSLGVVRFTKQVFQEVNKNYPRGKILSQDFVKSFDQKVRYPRPMRKWILSTVNEMLLEYLPQEKIYLCMED